MGQRKKDRTWPQNGRRRHTRHAWLTQPGVHEPPVQAFIIAWRRHSYRWQAYVIWVSNPDLLHLVKFTRFANVLPACSLRMRPCVWTTTRVVVPDAVTRDVDIHLSLDE